MGSSGSPFWVERRAGLKGRGSLYAGATLTMAGGEFGNWFCFLPVLPLTSCMILGTSLTFSEPQRSHLQNGYTTTEFLGGPNKVMHSAWHRTDFFSNCSLLFSFSVEGLKVIGWRKLISLS